MQRVQRETYSDDNRDPRDLQVASLDSQIRRFMHAEYGNSEPRAGCFIRVVKLIENDRRHKSLVGTCRAMLFNIARAIYHMLSGPTVSRLVSGGAALALVLLIIGANSARTLQNVSEDFYSMAVTTSSKEALLSNHAPQALLRGVAEEPTESALNITTEALVFDLVELQRPTVQRRDREHANRQFQEDFGTEFAF